LSSNTDTQVYPDWLSSLLQKIENSSPEVAAINPQILQMDNPESLDDAGDELSWYGVATKRGNGEPAAAHDKEAKVFPPVPAPLCTDEISCLSLGDLIQPSSLIWRMWISACGAGLWGIVICICQRQRCFTKVTDPIFNLLDMSN